MTIRSNLEGKKFRDMPSFIDGLEAGVRSELASAIQPFESRIAELEAAIGALQGKVDEIGSRQTSGGGGSGGGTGDGGGSGGTGGGTGEKTYVSVNLPFFLTFQLPDPPAGAFGVQLGGDVITPATLIIQGTDTQPDGVFTKYAVGSSVTVSANDIDNRVRFAGWEVNGQQVSTATTYTFTVPDQDPTTVTPTFVAASTPAPTPPREVTVTASWNVIGLGGAALRKSITINAEGFGETSATRASGQTFTRTVPVGTSVTIVVSPVNAGERITWSGPSGGTSDRDSFTFTATENATVRANLLLPL
jgi:hypothetical protein